MNENLPETLAHPQQYLLIFRNTEFHKRLPMDEMKEAMDKLGEWMARWTDRGVLKGGQPLADSGRVIAGARQRTVADGPFSESKEVVGGYVIIEADSIEAAAEVAAPVAIACNFVRAFACAFVSAFV